MPESMTPPPATDAHLVVRTRDGESSYELVDRAEEVPAAVEAGLNDGDDVQVFRMEHIPFRFVVEHRAHTAA
jgi:hypothetical protein